MFDGHSGIVFSVSAHPTPNSDYPAVGLVVTDLTTVYTRELEGPFLNFWVRNVSTSGAVLSYRVFYSAVNLGLP
jgi:hypothetical protein